MVLFKVPLEEKVPELPKAEKKPEAQVVPPSEEPAQKDKGIPNSSVTDWS